MVMEATEAKDPVVEEGAEPAAAKVKCVTFGDFDQLKDMTWTVGIGAMVEYRR